MSNSVKTKTYECPACLEQMDGATCISQDGPVYPKPGDFTVCIYCGAICRYTEADLEVATEEETKQLNPVTSGILEEAQKIIRQRRNNDRPTFW